MSHGLIVVPRSLRMFQRERRPNKPASAGGFRQHLESRCWKRPLRGWSLGKGSLAPRALRSERTNLHSAGQVVVVASSRPVNWKRHEADLLTGPGMDAGRHTSNVGAT